MTTSETLHSSYDKAERIANDCREDEENGWSYSVEQRGKWFAIVVRDERGDVLGAI